ncbi:MAG: fibronectin type III domain-containing protein, partial [Saprospiraceae bacterium]|nr:fibronectin type III domain-containing protein [Saprospiraceae bacterium]
RTVTNGTIANLTWLFYGTTYEYELRALCVDGWTNWSQTYQFTTANDPACTLPPYAGESVTETSFTVSWLSAPGIDQHIVIYRRVGDPDWVQDTLATDTFYHATNLLSGNTYQFRFRVHCPEGWSGWSDFKSLVTLVPAGNCDIPDTLYTNIGSTTATIAWTAENGANRYQIRYKLLSDTYWVTRTLTNNTVINLTWLYYDEDYEYQLRSECTGGWTDWSSEYYFTTLSDPACTTPWIVGHTTTATSFTVTWDPVYDIGEYHFRYREKGTSTWLNAYFMSGTSYMAYNLPGGTTYQYMMRSKCSNGWSSWTNLTEVTTDVSRPGPGKNPLVLTQSNESITMELFPNPVHEFLHIQWKGAEGSNVFLSDINGRLVRRIQWNGNGRMEVNVQSLQPGMYFITAINSDGTKLTERFIKAFK